MNAKRIAWLCALLLGVTSLAGRADSLDETSLLSNAPFEALASGPAASTLNTTQLVWGRSLTVNALSTSAPGTVSVRLTDIGWTDHLDGLSFLITDLNGISQRLSGPGELSFVVNGPTQLFAAVFARSGAGGVGLYNVQVGFVNSVPLPAAFWLLLSGLGALGFVRRRASQ